MGKKNKKTKVEKTATGPTLRWLVCEDGDVHIFGPCPRCFQHQWRHAVGLDSDGVQRDCQSQVHRL